jgi:hypothetical protein
MVSDVMGRLVEHGLPVLGVARVARYPQVAHAPAAPGASRAGAQMQGIQPTRCGMPGATE